MATLERQEIRGPRLGDAASLWNFTPAPGWTREEAQTLKVCLMKFGIGQWQAIHASGFLPGKLVQQCVGQTQRLLGQQSLAAFTGLQVDVDRIRSDNEQRTDVQRKGGLIIYSGPPPSKELKDQWRREAKEKYGLTVEQLKEVDESVQDMASLVDKTNSTVGVLGSTTGSFASLLPIASCKPSALIQPGAVPRRSKWLGMSSKRQGRPIGVSKRKAPRSTKQRSRSYHSSSEGSDHEFKDNGEEYPQENSDIEDQGRGGEAGASSKPPSGMGRRRNKTAAQEALAAALEADTVTLMDMGFSRRKAKEALETCDGDVQGACEWLFANCA